MYNGARSVFLQLRKKMMVYLTILTVMQIILIMMVIKMVLVTVEKLKMGIEFLLNRDRIEMKVGYLTTLQ